MTNIKENVVVNLEIGLHSRPAALFVQEASKYTSDINVIKGTTTIDAKSVLGVMSLSVKNGEEIVIEANGVDADIAVNKLKDLVSKTNIIKE
ncbi:HPr-like protein Crh [compost metagenome]